MNTMLEPRIVAARIQEPLAAAGCSHEPASINPSSQGVLAIIPTTHSLLAHRYRCCLNSGTGVAVYFIPPDQRDPKSQLEIPAQTSLQIRLQEAARVARPDASI